MLLFRCFRFHGNASWSAASTGDIHRNERHLYDPSGNFNLTVVPLSGCELRSTSPPLWRTNP